MIRINLLPEQYRRAERTSPKIFAALVVGVILVCSSVGWFGFVYFGELGNLEVEEIAVNEDLTNKQKQVAYFNDLQKEKKDYENRSRTIQSIGQSRILWTKIIDELFDVVNNEGNSERHVGWFRGISVKAGNARVGPTVNMPGWVQGSTMDKVADFHEDLENAEFFKDVRSKSAPSGVLETNAKMVPPQSQFFNMSWTFHPTSKWQKNKKAGAKKD